VELRRALARELCIDPIVLPDQHELLETINRRLLDLHALGKKVVLLLDEAQALPDDSLEALRLLTNLETGSSRLIQVVLFGQPELDERISRPYLRQLKQRIGFSCFLPKLTRKDLDIYLAHRLKTAGGADGLIFTASARRILYRASQGVPRIINILCHKALLLAWGRGDAFITQRIMEIAIYDTESATLSHRRLIAAIVLILSGVTALVLYWYAARGII
jgi:MSHA biogenesis protein MshM